MRVECWTMLNMYIHHSIHVGPP